MRCAPACSALHRGGWLEPRAVGRRSRYRLTAGRRGRLRTCVPPRLRPAVPALGRDVGRRDRGRASVGGPARAQAPARRARLGGLRPLRRRASSCVPRAATAPPVASRRRWASRDAMTAFDRARAARTRRCPACARAPRPVWSLAALAGDYRRFLARFGGVAVAFAQGAADARAGVRRPHAARPRVPARAPARSAASARRAGRRLAGRATPTRVARALYRATRPRRRAIRSRSAGGRGRTDEVARARGSPPIRPAGMTQWLRRA